jgi:hypothetical protein
MKKDNKEEAKLKEPSGPESHKILTHPEQENIKEDLPGYPHYPASEDILNPSNDMERLDVNVENIARGGKIKDLSQETGTSQPATGRTLDDLEEDDDLGIVPGTEADVTEEDLLLLGDKDQDMDMGEDEELQIRGLGVTGDDLDVPGEELDDPNEALGEEDEENNYYSLGGDNHENLDETSAE